MRYNRHIDLGIIYFETDIFRWRSRRKRNAREKELKNTRFERREYVKWRREGFTLIGQVYSTYKDRELDI